MACRTEVAEYQATTEASCASCLARSASTVRILASSCPRLKVRERGVSSVQQQYPCARARDEFQTAEVVNVPHPHGLPDRISERTISPLTGINARECPEAKWAHALYISGKFMTVYRILTLPCFGQKMAARRRLSRHEGVRAAIERGWWPYLPLRWVVLNDKEVLKVNYSCAAERGRCTALTRVRKVVCVRWKRLPSC